MPNYAIAVDIGGTNTRVALIDDTYHILDRKQFSTNATNPEETVNELANIINGYKEPIMGIGMSCPGPLDIPKGTILTPPNLTEGWHGYKLTMQLSELTKLPSYLNNDANLAALAEAVIGEGMDYRFVQFLTISTGIGAGFIIDKKIHLGAHGFGNEVANTIVWEQGPKQGELFAGAIEAVASGTAITKRALDAGLSVTHAGEVNDLAKAGNETALHIMTEAKSYLANYIAGIYGYADPDIVILGGSVSLKIEGFVEELEELVKERVFEVLRPHIKLRKTTLSEDSGLLGAACLVFSNQ